MASTEGHLLKNIPLFAQINDAERTELAALLKSRSYQQSQPVIWIGDPGADFYIVQQGNVTLSCPDESGNEMELATLGPGDFFGEISLLDGGPRTASARARTAATLLTLGREDFLQFLRTKPTAAIHVMTVLGSRTGGMLDKLRGLKNVNEAVEESTTQWHRVADRVSQWMVTPVFVVSQIALVAVWIFINEWQRLAGGQSFDIYPYCLLALVMSSEALFLSTFVLISQNRQGQRDRIRADLDYQVNVKAHLEVMQLHQKMDRLAALLDGDRKPRADGLVKELSVQPPQPPIVGDSVVSLGQ